MIVDEEIAFNMIQDFRKKDISPVKRAELIQSYLDHRGISQRQLARELDMSHSTLQDWVRYKEITESEYTRMLNKGIHKEDIYFAVRNNRKQSKNKIKELLCKSQIDIVLERVIKDLEQCVPVKEYTDDTTQMIIELKLLISKIEEKVTKVK